jgi:hypothetical protein
MRVLIVLCFAIQGLLAADQPSALRVVKTWADLQAQPLIDIGDGQVARFGIEDDRGHAGLGTTLYCLMADFTPPTAGADDWLGPVHVQVTVDGRDASATLIAWPGLESGGNTTRVGLSLYARLVPTPRLGSYAISLHSPHGKLLASGTVTVSDQALPWSDAGVARPGPRLLEADASSMLITLALGTSLDVPSCPGREPFALPPASPQSLLPAILPRTNTADAVLSCDDHQHLHLRLLHGLSIGDPDHVLLVRWWLNGAPLQIADSGAVFPLFCGAEQVASTLAFNLDPDIHLHHGDQVGIQMLVCPKGWMHYPRGDALLTMHLTGDPPRPLMTNRCDMVIP